MRSMVSTFETSIDDFVTTEKHQCIWLHSKATYYEPDELSLVSVDGMCQRVCPPDLWKAALSEYPDDLEPLSEYD